MSSNSSNTLPDIVQKKLFKAPIQKVWNAVATSEGIASWFMPNNFQPEVGYEFHLEAGPFGKSPCKVTELDPPNKLSFQWGESGWLITFELAEQDGQTEFTLIHSGWSAEGVTEFGEPHAVVRDRMNGGWIGLVGKLGAIVEG
jgi:uncharacterized protein YndB with AHSA1/START domain